jgi:hypothetical protein
MIPANYNVNLNFHAKLASFITDGDLTLREVTMYFPGYRDLRNYPPNPQPPEIDFPHLIHINSIISMASVYFGEFVEVTVDIAAIDGEDLTNEQATERVIARVENAVSDINYITDDERALLRMIVDSMRNDAQYPDLPDVQPEQTRQQRQQRQRRQARQQTELEHRQCPLCYTTEGLYFIAPCVHLICMACATRWIVPHGTCPVCRTQTRVDTLRPIG